MKKRYTTPVVADVAAIIGVILGFYLIPTSKDRNFPTKGSKIDYILSLIDSQYVDKVDIDSLQDGRGNKKG